MIFFATMVAGLTASIFNRGSLSVRTASLNLCLSGSCDKAGRGGLANHEWEYQSSPFHIRCVSGYCAPRVDRHLRDQRKKGRDIYIIRHPFVYREALGCLFKLVYVVSLAIALVGNIVAAEAKSIGVLIGMRVIQAIG